MRRRYVKLLYEKWDPRICIEEAIKAGDYFKSYFLDDLTIGRMDTYEPGSGLFKVSYRLVDPPIELIVEDHFREYPNVLCEIFTTPVTTGDGGVLVHTYLFASPGVLDTRYQLYYDKAGRVSKSVKLGDKGERLREELEAYDADGQWLSRACFDGSGQLIRVYNRDDD